MKKLETEHRLLLLGFRATQRIILGNQEGTGEPGRPGQRRAQEEQVGRCCSSSVLQPNFQYLHSLQRNVKRFAELCATLPTFVFLSETLIAYLEIHTIGLCCLSNEASTMRMLVKHHCEGARLSCCTVILLLFLKHTISFTTTRGDPDRDAT